MNKLSLIAYAIILVFMGCGGDTSSTGGNTGSSGGTKPDDSNIVNANKDTSSSNITKDKAGGDTNTATGTTDTPSVTTDKSSGTTSGTKDKSSDTTVTPTKDGSTYKGGYAVKKITFYDGSEQSFSYNEAGKITNITGHGFSSTDTYEYNTGGQLAKKGNGEYAYSGKGQLLTITTPSGVTTFSYNDKRQLVKKVVGSFSTTFSYNSNGQLSEVNDGNQITYTYDDLGKLKSAKYSNSSDETVYSYGSRGEILTSVTAGNTTTYIYDYKSCTSDFKVLFTDFPSQLSSSMCRR